MSVRRGTYNPLVSHTAAIAVYTLGEVTHANPCNISLFDERPLASIHHTQRTSSAGALSPQSAAPIADDAIGTAINASDVVGQLTPSGKLTNARDSARRLGARVFYYAMHS
ncbi:hypothetical protein F5Y04DRAFT_282555 [Hypomontagnella monticulosa]|nr:hypothetical protein F5Y04DRAFT_282555 [Hypomontagnella monticulosa]